MAWLKKKQIPKMKILSTFTNRKVAPNLHDFLNVENDDHLKTVSIVFLTIYIMKVNGSKTFKH